MKIYHVTVCLYTFAEGNDSEELVRMANLWTGKTTKYIDMKITDLGLY